jgi:nicotinamidase-related amidase
MAVKFSHQERSSLRRLLSEPTSLAVIVISSFLCLSVIPASAQTIVDEWDTVKAPKPPELKPVTVDPKTTAFLVLDIVKQTCNPERRPRCVASVPKIQAFLKQARAKGLSVIYSATTTSTAADILNEVAPLGGEPLVQTRADKFFKTDLEKILNDKGIKTVIVVGTGAHGAVLYTGSQAAFRGLQVIVPVDGMSSENTYFEQYTAYHLTNAPGVGEQVTLTKFDMIK